jgi:hypothetical protein
MQQSYVRAHRYTNRGATTERVCHRVKSIRAFYQLHGAKAAIARNPWLKNCGSTLC